MEPCRWKNCHADVMTWRNGVMVQAFLQNIVDPSLNALDVQIDEWSTSDDPRAPFLKDDMEALLRTTTMAFCLSIQSVWERQLRAYLRGCALELGNDKARAEKAMKGRWKDIDGLFFDLRGIRLSDFEEYRDLDQLYLLANACRHGDGPSAVLLWERHPELWPHRVAPAPLFESSRSSPQIQPPSIEAVVIPRSFVRVMVMAIVSFWDEVRHIYLESLEGMDGSFENMVMEIRQGHNARREAGRDLLVRSSDG